MKSLGTYVLVILLLCGLASGQAQASDFIVQMDAVEKTPRAQDDFYLWVNNEWLKKTVIPANHNRVEAFSLLDDKVQSELAALTAEAGQHTRAGTADADEKNIAAMNDCIKDYAGREKVGLGRLAEPLRQIEAVSSVQEYVNTMAALSRHIGFRGLVGSFKVDNEPFLNEQYAVWLLSPDTGLKKTAWAVAEQCHAYGDYISDILVLYGRDRALARQEAADIMALQKALLEPADDVVPLHQVEQGELARLYRQLDVQQMLQAGGIAPRDGLACWYAADTSALERMAKLLVPERLPLLKEYAIFKLLSDYGLCLTADYAAAASRYQLRQRGVVQESQATQRDLELNVALLADQYGRRYAARYGSVAKNQAVMVYVKRIMAVYRQKLMAGSWLSGALRNRAVAKLDALRVNIGWPEKWPAYLKEVDIAAPGEGGSLIDNVLRLRQQQRLCELAAIGKPVDRDLWRGLLPQTVNAFYHAADNSINFPAAILQAPFYDEQADDMVNLGGIGMLIAHEIVHSFDSQGALYDEKGHIKAWWTRHDWREYERRQAGIAAFYERYGLPDGRHEAGRVTLAENIADLGAMSCLTELAGGDKAALTSLFISYAQTWRDKMTPARLTELLTGVHALSAVRVNAVLSSTAAFYTAFAVQPGDGMYVPPAERASLW